MKALLSRYFPHVAEVWGVEGDVKGHIEVDETKLFSALPCYIYRSSNTWLNKMFGTSNVGKYNGILPTTFQEVAIEVKDNYTLIWIDRGQSRRLMILQATYFDDHIEIETEEIL